MFGATSGGGGLFGGLKPADDSNTKAASPEKSANKGDDNELVEEEEVTQIEGWTAEVTLEVKDSINTGEEDEEELYAQRSKLYRMKENEWKERGTGLAKLLKHKQTGKVRFLLRQEKTEKIVGNHTVVDSPPYCQIKPLDQSAKFRCWQAQDCSEDEPVYEMFALKFGSIEIADKFEEAFNLAKQGKLEATAGAAASGASAKAVKAPEKSPEKAG